MAAKHDGKHARANMWVTHQNLARAKGGRPGYAFQERKAVRAPNVAGVGAPPRGAPSLSLPEIAPAILDASPEDATDVDVEKA